MTWEGGYISQELKEITYKAFQSNLFFMSVNLAALKYNRSEKTTGNLMDSKSLQCDEIHPAMFTNMGQQEAKWIHRVWQMRWKF